MMSEADRTLPPCPSAECAATGCDCMIEDHHSFDWTCACGDSTTEPDGVCVTCKIVGREPSAEHAEAGR